MALLRSEIRVNCRDFLTRKPVEPKPIETSMIQPSTYKTNGRLALCLPLDQMSDGELDSLNGDSPLDDEITTLKQQRSNVEISPTDSAFHSDDFSPEHSCSRVECFSSDCLHLDGSITPSPEIATSLPDDGVVGKEVTDSGFGIGTQRNLWDSNWSVLSENKVPPHRFHVPLVIPVPAVPMKPRLGHRDADEVSELSDNRSVASLDLLSTSDSEDYMEDLSFLIELSDCRIGAGQVARFRCQLLGKNALSVSWFHGNKNVENGGRYRMYRQGSKQSLEIYFTTFADSGTVRCQAFSEDHMAETKAYLRIRESRLHPKPPEFVYKLESVNVVRGDDAELSCRIRGFPVPVLTFFIDGRKITPMDSGFEIGHIGNEEWLLVIDGKRLLSSAVVRCLATNPLGESACSATITIMSPVQLLESRDLLNVDRRLKNLDKKLSYTKEQMLSNAEEMLNNATQMSSLERQLSIVDEYLDRIESKFRKNKIHQVDKKTPAQMSVVEVSFPGQKQPDRTALESAQVLPLENSVKSGKSKSQSVSITVLSKHVQSDKVNVVFKKSFDSDGTLSEDDSTVSVPASSNLTHSTSSELSSEGTSVANAKVWPDSRKAELYPTNRLNSGSTYVSTEELFHYAIGPRVIYPSSSGYSVNYSSPLPDYGSSVCVKHFVATNGIDEHRLKYQEEPLNPQKPFVSSSASKFLPRLPDFQSNVSLNEDSETGSDDLSILTPESVPVPESVSCGDSVSAREKSNWMVEKASEGVSMEGDDNPYSSKNLKNRLTKASEFVSAALRAESPFFVPPPETVTLNVQRDICQLVTDSEVNKSSTFSEPELLQTAAEKVSRTTGRLHHLDNRIDILHKELDETHHSTANELKCLESAVALTAAEIQATERSIKQVESLVSRLSTDRKHQQQQEPVKRNSSGKGISPRRTSPDRDLLLQVIQEPAVVTYSSMASTPQDFPQDGPSVKSLMSRFQNDKPKVAAENGHHRRIGSVTSEESPEPSATPSPDKEHKPLPVFNKTKFQENVAANRALPRPKIHASLTARSLSREMREQLRISRPQMGAFRSNIMTAENGEYDPEKAAKAKELFIAESAQNNPPRPVREHEEEKVVQQKNVKPNRFKQDPFAEIHEDEKEHHEEPVADGKNAYEEKSHPKSNGFSEILQPNNHEEIHHKANGVKHDDHSDIHGDDVSRNLEDSLEEELDHEHEHEHEHESVHEDLPEDGHRHHAQQNGHEAHHFDDEIHRHDEEVPEQRNRDSEREFYMRNDAPEGDLVDVSLQGHKASSQDDDERDMPLSQAPDWDLLI